MAEQGVKKGVRQEPEPLVAPILIPSPKRETVPVRR